MVHANVAFSKSVVGTSTNIQRWSERHNKSSKTQKIHSLQRAIRDLIPHEDIAVTVFPVMGNERSITHFMIETSVSDDPYDNETEEETQGNADQVVAAGLKRSASDDFSFHSLSSVSSSSSQDTARPAQAVG